MGIGASISLDCKPLRTGAEIQSISAMSPGSSSCVKALNSFAKQRQNGRSMAAPTGNTTSMDVLSRIGFFQASGSWPWTIASAKLW